MCTMSHWLHPLPSGGLWCLCCDSAAITKYLPWPGDVPAPPAEKQMLPPVHFPFPPCQSWCKTSPLIPISQRLLNPAYISARKLESVLTTCVMSHSCTKAGRKAKLHSWDNNKCIWNHTNVFYFSFKNKTCNIDNWKTLPGSVSLSLPGMASIPHLFSTWKHIFFCF